MEKNRNEFQIIMQNNRNVGEMIKKIVTALNEHTRSLEEVNNAVGAIGILTQQNAERVQESGNLSELMNKEAEELTQLVNELIILIGIRN